MNAAFVIRFLLVALAVYRLTHAFALETGPGALFVNAREWIIKRYGHESWQAEFARCPLCQSFWGGLIGSALCFPWTGVIDWLLIGVAVAGVVLVVHNWLYK